MAYSNLEQWIHFDQLPIHAEYDVVVFGAGAAGCTAAIQSARAGKKTALIEKNGVLGGTTVMGSVNFPGLFHAWGKQVIAGIGWEAISRTVELGGAELPDFSTPPPRHWHHQILVNRFIYSTVLDQLCLEAGVNIKLHEMPAAVLQHAGWIYIASTGKSGLKWYKSSKVVDATGDANITGMMGYPRKKGSVLQPGTLIHDLDGYDLDEVDVERLDQLFDSAVRSKKYTSSIFRKGPNPFRGYLKSRRISMHVQGIDGSESDTKTAAELKARQILMECIQFLRQVPGCEKIEVRYFANECGIRESWIVDGMVEIDQEAYTSGYIWPDAVCYSFYPIDLHHHNENRIVQQYLEPDIVATIPYRALVPKGSEHLLVAGRCLSGDRMANSAYRVQATCMATGQVAGMAAAIAADKDISVQQVPLLMLKEQLKHHGAIVPSG